MRPARSYELPPRGDIAGVRDALGSRFEPTDTLDAAGVFVHAGQTIRIDVANGDRLKVAVGRPDFGAVRWVNLEDGRNVMTASKDGILHFLHRSRDKTAYIEIYGAVD